MSGMTPRELYAAEPKERHNRVQEALTGCYFDHLPEVPTLNNFGHFPDLEKQDRVEVRVVAEEWQDFRRFWRISTVWLNGSPFMVCTNGGREGDDHAERFVTDGFRLVEAATYLTSITVEGQFADDVSIDAQIPELTRFYGWDGERAINKEETPDASK